MTDRPEIEIVQGREPDLDRAGANVVIDVLRAFTTTHVAFERGCSEILLAETVEEAFELADHHADYLLAGERDARRVEGFDAGNAPGTIEQMDLEGRGLILTTTNGVRATLNALEAEHVLVTGWSNATATATYLQSVLDELEPPRLHLVASHPISDEDVACAEFLAGRVGSREPPTPSAVTSRIRAARSAQKFYGREFDLRDLDLACRRVDSPYAMRVEIVDGLRRIRPVRLP